MDQPKPEQFKLKRQPVALIVVAYMVGYVQAFVTAFSLMNGLWPSAMAAPGPMSRVLPVILCLGITICLGSVWKVIFHHAARTKSLLWGSIWLLLAVLALGASIGTSGRYMAALVDGAGAIQEHERDYRYQLEQATSDIGAHVYEERPLIGILEAATANLRAVQDSERRLGAVSGKAGDRGVTDTIGRQVSALATLTSKLKDLDQRRVDYLMDVERRSMDALIALSNYDEAGFREQMGSAVQILKKAEAINLLDITAGLGTGMVIDAARGPFDQIKRQIDDFVTKVREQRHPVVIPVFVPMTDKNAVMAYPPVAAWILAIMVESFPFFMAVALLLSNLEGLKPTLAPAE